MYRNFITYFSTINGFNQEVPGKCHTLSLQKVHYKSRHLNNGLTNLVILSSGKIKYLNIHIVHSLYHQSIIQYNMYLYLLYVYVLVLVLVSYEQLALQIVSSSSHKPSDDLLKFSGSKDRDGRVPQINEFIRKGINIKIYMVKICI